MVELSRYDAETVLALVVAEVERLRGLLQVEQGSESRRRLQGQLDDLEAVRAALNRALAEGNREKFRG